MIFSNTINMIFCVWQLSCIVVFMAPYPYTSSVEHDLWQASCLGDWRRVNVLLTKGTADIEEPGGAGQTPLQIAACGGFDDVVNLLLDHGADEFVVESHSRTTLLHCAAGAGVSHGRGMGGTMRRLLQTVASVGRQESPCIDVNARDFLGRTALHFAARSGTIDSLEQLLLFGADPSLVDHNGDSPMHVAASCCSTSKCFLLVGYMTPETVRIQNLRGETALHYGVGRGVQLGSVKNRPSSPEARAQRVELVKMFFKSDIDLFAKDQYGNTAEDVAIRQGRTDVVHAFKVRYLNPFRRFGRNVIPRVVGQIWVSVSTIVKHDCLVSYHSRCFWSSNSHDFPSIVQPNRRTETKRPVDAVCRKDIVAFGAKAWLHVTSSMKNLSFLNYFIR